jgi:anti-sigma factor RsiW
MTRPTSKRLDAYRDGALDAAERRKLEQRISGDPALGRELKRRRAMSVLVRDAWTEGPTAPSAEYLIAALRPALADVDAELERRPAWSRAADWLARWATPRPLAVLTVGAAAAALVLLPPAEQPVAPGLEASATVAPRSAPRGEAAPAAASPSLALGRAPADAPAAVDTEAASFRMGMPAAIDDIAQGDTPLMLFEAPDGSTIIWVLGEDDGVSLLGAPHQDGWV